MRCFTHRLVIPSEVEGPAVGSVVLVLALIAIGASFLPTLRISRIQPADTLRAE